MTRRAYGQVSVVGLGFMGSSLGVAVRKRKMARLVVGVDADQNRRREARQCGVVDEVTADLAAGLKEADLIVLALPVAAIIEVMPQVARSCREGALVTDTGATKAAVVAAAEESFPPGKFFVGAHPLSGSPKSGPRHAEGEIFKNSGCYVTPGDKTSPRARDEISAFWRALGAKLILASPKRHDELAALTSHLPHFSAVALALIVERLSEEKVDFLKQISGLGFRSATWTAESPASLWLGVCQTNEENITAALAAFKEELDRLAAELKAQNLEALAQKLDQARRFRARF